MTEVIIIVAVLVLATIAGIVMKSRSGRVHQSVAHIAVQSIFSVLPEAQVDPTARVTAIQFSSAFCQPCRATRVILDDVAQMIDGFAHVDIDAESHLEQIRTLDIRKTPTVVFVDAGGMEFARASGQPRKADVIATVADHL